MNNAFFEINNDSLLIIDQTKLPDKRDFIELHSIDDYFQAIKELKVRGAPAIGIAAAFGIAFNVHGGSIPEIIHSVNINGEILAASRPTAVNLFHSIERMKAEADIFNGEPENLKKHLINTAFSIMHREIQNCMDIADNGLSLISKGMRILTHCNTGMLATPGIGTALGIIYNAFDKGLEPFVWVPETRPLLQGSRLTAYELKENNIPFRLITDNMRGALFRHKMIDIVITGADRIAANGDTANKIGTYESAVLARHHNIPFYVAAPLSTFDLNIQTGNDILIEERAAEEILSFRQCSSAPECSVYNPAFDVTPAGLIEGIITEKGIVRAKEQCIKDLF